MSPRCAVCRQHDQLMFLIQARYLCRVCRRQHLNNQKAGN
jgi:hypothetical protein